MGEQRDVPARPRVGATWLSVQEESSTSPAARGDSRRHHGQDVWASGLLQLVCPLVWWGGHVWSHDPHILQTIVSPGPEAACALGMLRAFNTASSSKRAKWHCLGDHWGATASGQHLD